jgi:hypothetical protein
MSTFRKLVFNSHKNHNPQCDILEGHLDVDTMITYGIYENGPKKGLEFMEYYSGKNYVCSSNKKSHSRYFSVEKIPAKYKKQWCELKDIYEIEYKNK